MPRLVLAILIALLPLANAWAQSPRRAAIPSVVAIQDAPEGIGCTWYRQRMTCSRYCYIEIDGHRLCRERAREAHAQAPFAQDLPPMALTPMK